MNKVKGFLLQEKDAAAKKRRPIGDGGYIFYKKVHARYSTDKLSIM